MPPKSPVALSAFHHKHVELGAVMEVRDGWMRPLDYGKTGREEYALVGESGGMFDVSPKGKIRVTGKDIDGFLYTALTGYQGCAVGRLALARAAATGGDGGDTLVVARLTDEEYIVFTPPTSRIAVAKLLQAAGAGCAHIVDVTSAMAGVRIYGPNAPAMLAGLAQLDTSPEVFPDYACAQTRLAEIHGTVLRRDTNDHLAYEVYVSRDYADYAWDAIIATARHHGVTPIGLTAARMLR